MSKARFPKISKRTDADLAQRLNRAADFIAQTYPAQTVSGYSFEGLLSVSEFKLDQMRNFLAHFCGALDADAPQAAEEIRVFLDRVRNSAQRAAAPDSPAVAL